MCSRPKKGTVAKKVRKYLKHKNLRNARQILDLARPEKIWPRSQKPKKIEGRQPLCISIFAEEGSPLLLLQ
jgi:hypothetical protein